MFMNFELLERKDAYLLFLAVGGDVEKLPKPLNQVQKNQEIYFELVMYMYKNFVSVYNIQYTKKATDLKLLAQGFHVKENNRINKIFC